MVARPLLRSRLGKHFPGVMLLQFQGRRTGRVMRIPVTINLVDGVPMAFTDAARRHNFTATIPVTVSHPGGGVRDHRHVGAEESGRDGQGRTEVLGHGRFSLAHGN